MRNAKGGRAIALALAGCLTTLLFAVAPAQAASPAKWKMESLSASSVEPGGVLHYVAEARNIGATPTDPAEAIELSATLPAGVSVVSASVLQIAVALHSCTFENGGPGEASKVSCPHTTTVGTQKVEQLRLTTIVDPDATGTLKSEFKVSGGGAGSAEGVDFTRVGPILDFGIETLDSKVVDAAGDPYSQAAGHPDSISTTIDFNTYENTKPLIDGPFPVQGVRDVFAELSPGFVGSPKSVAQCTLAQLANVEGIIVRPLCPPESQVGTSITRVAKVASSPNSFGPLPLFNMNPAGSPARFGFNVLGTIVVLDATLRSDGNYGLTVAAEQISEGLGVAGSTATFWGVPADEIHGPDQQGERTCPGEVPVFKDGGTSCPSNDPATPFLRTPTSCTSTPHTGLRTEVHIDSWGNPGALISNEDPDLSDPAWKTALSTTHEAPGYPYPPDQWGPEVGITGCAGVPFVPAISAEPTTNSADSPSGLNVDLTVPQDCWEAGELDSICQSDLKDARVTLPAGMSVNPSSASGLGSCNPSQIGLTTPVGQVPAHFTKAPAACPDASKIGNVTIETPLLSDPLKGAVYLASQGQNPFGSLLAMYLVAEGSGVVVKQAGEIKADPVTGQLTTTFTEAPQTPFSALHLSLFGGPRAALRTPSACGTYTTRASLTPWSHQGTAGEEGTPVAHLQSSFAVTSGPSGSPCPNNSFDPKLSAGTTNPLAATYSPFALRLTRADGTQEFASLKATLPEGLLANLAGVGYCPDSALAAISGALGSGAAQAAQPSCPASSLLGTLTAGAGAGPTPFFTERGRLYFSGPYKGAPYSLAAVVPALAGPFDLGTVVVRNALRVDPETTRVTVDSDPFPQSLYGIPLDLRDLRVDVSRPEYTLNPTSCEERQTEATLTSAQGARANRSERFQAAACDRLAFRPRLSLRLRGRTARSGHPALTTVLRARPGQANIGRIAVTLPHSEFLAQSHIRTICTRVQFAAGQCPRGSVYGHASATSPLVDYAFTGPVYLRSSSNPLPDLVLALKGPGQTPLEIDAVGRIDSVRGGIRATFPTVPDSPLTRVVLRMGGGRKSLLENSTNICRRPHYATVQMDGQNGKIHDFRAKLGVRCGGKGKRQR